jgi:hypothetical protein
MGLIGFKGLMSVIGNVRVCVRVRLGCVRQMRQGRVSTGLTIETRMRTHTFPQPIRTHLLAHLLAHRLPHALANTLVGRGHA